MSLETWKAEFYPVEATTENVEPEEAVAHSLRKWEGLRAETLAAHGLRVRDGRLEDGTDWMGIDAATCALCTHYLNDNWPDEDEDDEAETSRMRCENCPLFAVLGRSCDDDIVDGNGERIAYGPYFLFIERNDPEPMIAALKKAAELEAKK